MTEKELNEQKKEYLNEYKKLCKKIRSLEEQLQSLRESTESAKIQEITDMPRGSKQSDLSDYMVRVEKLELSIYSKKLERNNKQLDIEECIANLDDGIESDIIRKRYIELKPWEQICVEVGYSWMQTHRIHGNALRNICIRCIMI